MAFKFIDSTAYSADKPLDTFLLRTNRDNLQACIDDRPVQGVWTPHTYNTDTGALLLPEISGYNEPSCVVLWFWVPPGVTHLGVIVEQQVATTVTANPYTSEITLRAAALPRAVWESPSRASALTSWTSTTVAGGASSSSATELTLDVSGNPPGWTSVVVGWQSGTGDWTEILDSGGSGPNCFTGWWPGHIMLDTAASNTIGTGNQTPHWVVRVADAGGKESISIAKGLFEPPRKVLLITDNGSGANRFGVYCWPPLLRQVSIEGLLTQHLSATDMLWYQPLGVATLSGVTVYTKAEGDLPDPLARLDATQPAAMRVVQTEVYDQVRTWLERPRVHAMGPLPNPSQTDWTTFGPTNRISSSVYLDTTYSTLALASVGGDDAFQRRPQAGAPSTYTKSTVDVIFTVGVFQPSNAGGNHAWDLDFRVRVADQDGASNTVDVTLPVDEVLAPNCPVSWYFNGAIPDYDDSALLTVFNATSEDPHDLWRHTMAGVLPVSVLKRLPAVTLTMRVRDTSPSATRIALLQVRSRDGGSPLLTAHDEVTTYRPRIHLFTWSVVSAATVDREPAVSELGV